MLQDEKEKSRPTPEPKNQLMYSQEIPAWECGCYRRMIVGIGDYQGKEEHDLKGKYLCPGFIDSHLHSESTPCYTRGAGSDCIQTWDHYFIVDPHESANVSGLEGSSISWIRQRIPANVYVMMPSCVPATGIDDNGCTLTAEDMVPYLSNKRILGLGEVMDYLSVVNGDKSMHDKLLLFGIKLRMVMHLSFQIRICRHM